MTPFPGVHRRSDSLTWQFGLRVPKDLASQFRSAWAVRRSLGTSELREANDKAKALQAEWAARFESMRSGKPALAPAPPTLDLAALRTKMLARAERHSLPLVDGRSAALTPEARVESADRFRYQRDFLLEGLKSGYDASEFADEWLDAILGEDRPQAAVTEALAFYAGLTDLFAESMTDHTRTFPRRVEWLAAKRALAVADAPLIKAATPDVPMAQATGKGRKIADALGEWKMTQTRAKTIGVFSRHAEQFAGMMGDPDLSSVGRVEASLFRDKLQAWAMAEKKTASTADNALVSIRALANVARDKGWIQSNPFERLAVKVGGKEAEGREPWTHEELRVLFDDPIWTQHRLPEDRKVGAEAAYWIPLIACYTGARVTEIAQLWTDDLTLAKGAEVIEFRDNEGREQRLKTEGSWRAVPMHSELVRLGLPGYAASLPSGPLFPKLPTAGRNGAGGQFGQWFGAFKRGKGFTSPQKTLHSFRHLVATELRLAGASEAQADGITGHVGEGVARKTYSATIRRNAERLRPVIELLRFDATGCLRARPSASPALSATAKG